ncbi:MAG: hypothetical protein ACI9JY_002380, partial [Saprospiraceae bacterium]
LSRHLSRTLNYCFCNYLEISQILSLPLDFSDC